MKTTIIAQKNFIKYYNKIKTEDYLIFKKIH